ncbi:hypothetical protein K3495_g11484 [Podosphaera aphanis]|nr:hypothetical protein K3495_g11484 [Podosphaera aphanis]
MLEDSVTMRRPVETLTKSEWRQVFMDLQLWLESKGLFYVCENIREDYCSWQIFQCQDSPVIEKDRGSKENEVEKLTAHIDNLNINKKSSLNTEKAT